jgi:hypothetical protein
MPTQKNNNLTTYFDLALMANDVYKDPGDRGGLYELCQTTQMLNNQLRTIEVYLTVLVKSLKM